MARRIGLAQALINDPDLLILDEPTTGLDPIGTRQIKDLILKLAERGKTILLCSHLLADVEDVCDRIAILYGGKIQAQGQVKDLLQQTDKKQIITDAISDAAVEKIKQIVQAEHADCVITSPMDRLETFFIKTVSAAQQQAQPTSGAVSTTRLGDFLTAASAKESILDKLVSAPVTGDTSQKAPVTQRVVPTETSEAARPSSPRFKPDEQLLTKLTGPVKPSSSDEVVKDKKAKTEPVEHKAVEQREVKKSILDQLTGRPMTQNADKGQTDKSQAGENTNA
jgi:ABC-2 type transport system ATP-binding protein